MESLVPSKVIAFRFTTLGLLVLLLYCGQKKMFTEWRTIELMQLLKIKLQGSSGRYYSQTAVGLNTF